MRSTHHNTTHSPLAYLVGLPSATIGAGALTLFAAGEAIRMFNQASSGSDTQYVVARSLSAGGWLLLSAVVVTLGASRRLPPFLRPRVVLAGSGFALWCAGDVLDGIGNVGYGSSAVVCFSSLATTLGSLLLGAGIVACALAAGGPRWLRPGLAAVGLFFGVDAAGGIVGAIEAYANPWTSLAVTAGVLAAAASLGIACSGAWIAASPKVHPWLRPRLMCFAGGFMVTGIGQLVEAFSNQQNVPNSVAVTAIAIQAAGGLVFAFVIATMAPRAADSREAAPSTVPPGGPGPVPDAGSGPSADFATPDGPSTPDDPAQPAPAEPEPKPSPVQVC